MPLFECQDVLLMYIHFPLDRSRYMGHELDALRMKMEVSAAVIVVLPSVYLRAAPFVYISLSLSYCSLLYFVCPHTL